ncbi:hypothetical protein KHA80_14215 [Anaerobacillus sp. HL2]|nr:hypothetical protein KHA80_14215 [Anaerobacillus sp. HL2]
MKTYDVLKAKGLTDKQIVKEMRIGTNTLFDFKKEHGIVGKRKGGF